MCKYELDTFVFHFSVRSCYMNGMPDHTVTVNMNKLLNNWQCDFLISSCIYTPNICRGKDPTQIVYDYLPSLKVFWVMLGLLSNVFLSQDVEETSRYKRNGMKFMRRHDILKYTSQLFLKIQSYIANKNHKLRKITPKQSDLIWEYLTIQMTLPIFLQLIFTSTKAQFLKIWEILISLFSSDL